MTGGAGFIGYHLSKYLSSEHDITIVDNLSRGKMDDDFKELVDVVGFINMDMTNYKDFSKLDCYDYIIHLVAVNGTKNFYKNPYGTARTNALTLINMLDWIKEHKMPKKFIWTSSSEVYAQTPKIPIPTPEEVDMTINDPFNPRLSYASSKIFGEVVVSSFSKNFGLPFMIVRPHNIYGPRMGYDHVIPEFIQRILSKEDPFKIYGGNETRSFCYIDDFIDGISRLMFCDEANQIYHIGNPSEIKIIDLAKMMFDLFNHNPELEICPSLEGSVMRRCPDISKLQKLGYNPRVSLEEGLCKTFDWYTKKEM